MEDEELKAKLIDEIIFKCKVSNVSSDKYIPLDVIFMNLIGCNISQLKMINNSIYGK